MKISIKLLKLDDRLLKEIVLEQNSNFMEYPNKAYQYEPPSYSEPFHTVREPVFLKYYDNNFFTFRVQMYTTDYMTIIPPLSAKRYIGIKKYYSFIRANENDYGEPLNKGLHYDIIVVDINDAGILASRSIFKHYSMHDAYDNLLRNLDMNYVLETAIKQGILNEIEN